MQFSTIFSVAACAVLASANPIPDPPAHGTIQRTEGIFWYSYHDIIGHTQRTNWAHPPAGVCKDIPEAANPATQKFAFSATNNVEYEVVLYEGLACQGKEVATLKADKGCSNEKQHFRSFFVQYGGN